MVAEGVEHVSVGELQGEGVVDFVGRRVGCPDVGEEGPGLGWMMAGGAGGEGFEAV